MEFLDIGALVIRASVLREDIGGVLQELLLPFCDEIRVDLISA